ncbi:MAG: hypothetical protein V7609_3204 [Verrucomicrobiota bacterium]
MSINAVFRSPQLAVVLALLLWGACDSTPKQEPPISDIDWRLINAIYNVKYRKTDLQKEERWKEFKGRKVKWTGEVTSVGDSMFGGLELQVKMNPDTWTSDLLIELKASQRSRATRLNKGDLVTFTGILDSWGTILPITLKGGEIID